jgi:photosystem II stability/assembly factor-like uncharacterized protein/DNA-binding CsgD family transcriptional regulator
MTTERARRGRGRPRHPDILTPREWQVLELLREGLTNEQIAQRLDISLAGAKYHVSEILTKLGLTSREQAAAWQPEAVAVRWWQRVTAWLPRHAWPLAGAAAGLAALAALAGLAALVWAAAQNGDEPASVAQPSSVQTQPPTSQLVGSSFLPAVDLGWRDIADASCIDPDHCWLAAGSDILASNDGGVHWSRQYEARSGEVGLGVSNVEFVSKTHGWATTGVSLIESEDGGQSWNVVTISEPPPDSSGGAIPRDIDFVDDEHGFAMIGSLIAESLRRTADAGVTWQEISTPCPEASKAGPPATFDFISATTGWVICMSASKTVGPVELFDTQDSGETWNRLADLTTFTSEDLAPFYDLDFVDERVGWLGAGRAGLFGTEDGGLTWTKFAGWPLESLPAAGSVFPLAEVKGLTSVGQVLVISKTAENSAVFHTLDGGQTWSHLYPPPPPGANARQCTAEDLTGFMYVQGAGGQLVGGVRFLNASSTPCLLKGTPELESVEANGEVLLRSKASPGDATPVIIYPGQRAVARVQWLSGCGPPPGKEIVALLQGGGTVAVSNDVTGSPTEGDAMTCRLNGVGEPMPRSISVGVIEATDPPINPP